MPARHRFGRFEVCPDERSLLADGQPTALGARAFDLLLALIERRQKVVTKDELLQLVWGGPGVGEGNLHTQVSTLRAVLGTQAIATIPGRGYRFAMRLEGQPEGEPEAAGPALVPSRADAAPSSAPISAGATPSTRKLTAILSSDVAGYSRLMGEDDRATLEAIVATRAAMATLIAQHGGRVVDATGDALLAEFPSAVESVRCAVAIQDEQARRNAPVPQQRRMVLRIGLNVGDVIEQDAALYGEGVNVAARLQALGEPGGVCLSGSIFDQVDGRLPLAFRFAGEQSVKNIAKPVRAYHVGAVPPGGAANASGSSGLRVPLGGYRFGSVELRPDERQLLIDAEPAKLGARAFDVLLALIEHRERMLGKNELLDLVWPGVVVEEHNLPTQVSNLRKLLGPDVIETIPGRGYRFVAVLEGARPLVQKPAAAAAPVSAVPSAPSHPGFKTNLPETLAPLFGRDDDVAALGALIAQHRLISIVAAGGMGKTRLALQLLHERRGAFEHGVCWVELAGLSDPHMVASTAASALGIQTGMGDPLQGLVASLKGMSLMVVLDNAEHLIDEVARVVQALVEGAPKVRLLITSQVPLKCSTERVYRLGPLAVPDVAVPVDEALTFGAIALFIECAQAADRHFGLTADNVSTVIDICRHLDGMALAIEMAAARVPLLGVAKLAATLNERLRVLTGGSRGAPQRQKTLRAALEWSHALLNVDEQAVFRRLGVFAGGFSLAIAQQVVADETGEPPLDEWAVLDLLGALVDRSLAMADAGEPPRYRLLESPRAFALERMAAAGEATELRRRHAQAVLARFTEVDADCWAGRVGVDAAIATLEPDLDNGREALRWSLANVPQTAVALAAPLAFALTYDRREELLWLWESTADLVVTDTPDKLRAGWAASCARFWVGEKPALASQWAQVAIDLYRKLEDRMGEFFALSMLTVAEGIQASKSAAPAFSALLELEDKRWPARLRFFGALAESFMRRISHEELDLSSKAMHRWSELAELAGDSYERVNGLVSLADNALAAGRPDEAVQLEMNLIRLLQLTRNASSLGVVQLNLVGALLAQGSLADARKWAEQALPLARQFGRLDWLADGLSLLAALEGRGSTAARLLGYGDSLYAAQGLVRQFNEARTVERAEQVARERIGNQHFERCKAAGAKLSEEEFVAFAFSKDDPP